MLDVGILGAGGHARSVYDCLVLSVEGPIHVRFYDDRCADIETFEGHPVVGPIRDALEEGEPHDMFVAIGSNATRLKLTKQLQKAGRNLLTILHPGSTISPRSTIGSGVVAIAGSVVNAGATVGDGAILNTLCSVGHDCIVLPFAQIAPGVNLGGGARIGLGAFLGLGVKVAPDVVIGDWTVVGAGSVVLRELPEATFCYGTPARVIRELSDDELRRIREATAPG